MSASSTSSQSPTTATAELVLFPLLLASTLAAIAKHKSKTWLPLCIPIITLCALRTASAVLVLESQKIQQQQKGQEGQSESAGGVKLLAISSVFDDITGGPLLLAVAGVLIRVNLSLARGIPFRTFAPVQILTLAGIITIALGQLDSSHSASAPQTSPSPPLTTQAGTTILLAALLGLQLPLSILIHIKARSAPNFNYTQDGSERDLAVAILVLTPTVLLRLLWGLIAAFWPDAFSALDGDASNGSSSAGSGENGLVWLHFVMVPLSEVIVAGTLIVIALTMRVNDSKHDENYNSGNDSEGDAEGVGGYRSLNRNSDFGDHKGGWYRGGVGSGGGRAKDARWSTASTAYEPYYSSKGIRSSFAKRMSDDYNQERLRPLIIQGGDIHDPVTWGPI
ncbi:hypothetical protein F5Y16DRAFT_420537 [Xylariaceae sp. FL0255]|nr:hypothetical protein F5Y16DRAFT_420537 [Xylariaceae sp. FL0255]